MPYSVESGREDCAGYGVYKKTDLSLELVTCHTTEADAKAHLAALVIATEYEREAEQSDSDIELREPYSVTDGMVEEAKRGLEWRSEFGRGGTEIGIARARDISNRRNLPIETVRRMHSYFSRHEVDKQAEGFSPGEDGYPSNGRIAWALWGGDAGQSWAANIVASVAAEDDREIFDVKEFESRALPIGDFSVTETEDGQRTFSGYAALFNEPSAGLPFKEVIVPGAFKRTLSRAARNERLVKFLHGHDENRMLATTASGRLKLSEDERGLRVEAQLDPSDPDAAAIISKLTHEAAAMGMSFGFSVPKGGDLWAEDTRTLKEITLHEVSILSGSTPAYPSTIGLTAVRHLAEEKIGVPAEQLMNTLEAIKSAQPLTEDDLKVMEAVRDTLAPKTTGIHPSVAQAQMDLRAMLDQEI